MGAVLLATCCAVALQIGAPGGSNPRKTPEKFAAHGKAGELTVAAEFHYRAVQHHGVTVFLRNQIVIEAALFGPDGRRGEIRAGDFRLYVNGKKSLYPESPGLVNVHEQFDSAKTLDIQAQDVRVRIGGAPPGPRHPGDHAPVEPPVQIESPGSGGRQTPPLKQLLAEAALPEGDRLMPISGLLYFHYPKKPKSIRKMVLVYENPAMGRVTLELR